MIKRARFILFTASSVLAAAGLASCNKAPEATASAPAASTAVAGANIADTDVTENVKTALRQSDSLKGLDITVQTLKGDVRLNGMVDNQAQIDAAIAIARAAGGTQTVHDELTIRK
jgi:hyperosmotically inducible protein